MNKWLLSVPTLFGLESLAAREIRMLGYDTEQVEDGRVSFYGDERAICRANIWLRTAERVQIKLGDFKALSFTELFDQTKALQWPELLPGDADFPVNGHCLSSKLSSVPDCQAIIKKAAVESMKSRWNYERFSETGPLYRINFNIIRDRVAIYVDTSGEGLHKRGYRDSAAPTPIKETLASALVELSRWRPGKALWDPFCGSGTIAIEAAAIAANRAPGMTRCFAAECWGEPYKMLFCEERAKAREVFEKRLGEITANRASIEIAGSDLSRQCIRASRQNAEEAGVSRLIRFFQMDAKHMNIKHKKLAELGISFAERGCIVTNPPYGERYNDKVEALETCGEWAPTLAGFQEWSWCIISAIDDFEKLIGRRASKRRKLYNGKIKCQAYLYW